jgi:hypothetical protein
VKELRCGAGWLSYFSNEIDLFFHTSIKKFFLLTQLVRFAWGNMNPWKQAHNTEGCGVSRIDRLDNAVSILALGLEQRLADFFGSLTLKVLSRPN